MTEESGGGSFIAPKSKYNEVARFFPVSVDDFFDKPDRIVRYVKSLPKEPDSEGYWPGKRTEQLWKINKELSDAIVLKVLSCYYDLTYQSVSWRECDITFQETPRFSKNKNDMRNRGWIHRDDSTVENNLHEMAGLVYLTPDIDPDSGTSLFMLKSRSVDFLKQFGSSQRPTIDKDYYEKKIKEEEKLFIEKVRFANIYNRMIMYDTKEYHRANSYYNEDGKDVRLTLVFFIGGLEVETYPLERIREKNCNEFIEHQIMKETTRQEK